MPNVVEIVLRASGAQAKAEIADTSKRIKQLGETASSVGTRLSIFGGAGVAAFTLVGRAAIKAAADMEQTKVAFTTLLKDGGKATAMLKDLYKFAATTPWTFPDVTTAAKQLLAYGFSAKQVIPMLRTLGDASASLGLGADGMGRLIAQLGQMKAAGRASLEDLKVMTEAGIPVFDILREKLKLSGDEVRKIGESGRDANEVITALMQGMKDRFGGGTEAQAKTLAGIFSNMQESIRSLMTDIEGKGFGDQIAKNIKGPASDALKSIEKLKREGKLDELAKAIGRAVGDMAKDLAKAIKWFGEHPKVAEFALKLGAVAAGTSLVAGTTLKLFGPFATLFAWLVKLRKAWVAYGGAQAAASAAGGALGGAAGRLARSPIGRAVANPYIAVPAAIAATAWWLDSNAKRDQERIRREQGDAAAAAFERSQKWKKYHAEAPVWLKQQLGVRTRKTTDPGGKQYVTQEEYLARYSNLVAARQMRGGSEMVDEYAEYGQPPRRVQRFYIVTDPATSYGPEVFGNKGKTPDQALEAFRKWKVGAHAANQVSATAKEIEKAVGGVDAGPASAGIPAPKVTESRAKEKAEAARRAAIQAGRDAGEAYANAYRKALEMDTSPEGRKALALYDLNQWGEGAAARSHGNAKAIAQVRDTYTKNLLAIEKEYMAAKDQLRREDLERERQAAQERLEAVRQELDSRMALQQAVLDSTDQEALRKAHTDALTAAWASGTSWTDLLRLMVQFGREEKQLARDIADQQREQRIATLEVQIAELQYHADWMDAGKEKQEALQKIIDLQRELATLQGRWAPPGNTRAEQDQVDAAGQVVKGRSRMLEQTVESFSDRLVSILNGSKPRDAWKAFLEDIKRMFLQLLSKLIAEWILHEIGKTAITKKYAAKRAASESAGRPGALGLSGIGNILGIVAGEPGAGGDLKLPGLGGIGGLGGLLGLGALVGGLGGLFGHKRRKRYQYVPATVPNFNLYALAPAGAASALSMGQMSAKASAVAGAPHVTVQNTNNVFYPMRPETMARDLADRVQRELKVRG